MAYKQENLQKITRHLPIPKSGAFFTKLLSKDQTSVFSSSPTASGPEEVTASESGLSSPVSVD